MVISIPTKTSENIEDELRLKNILEQMEGIGTVNVMMTYKDKNKEEVEGVAIITDGAENVVVVKNITEVVQALFDVDSHKIKVMKGNYKD